MNLVYPADGKPYRIGADSLSPSMIQSTHNLNCFFPFSNHGERQFLIVAIILRGQRFRDLRHANLILQEVFFFNLISFSRILLCGCNYSQWSLNLLANRLDWWNVLANKITMSIRRHCSLAFLTFDRKHTHVVQLNTVCDCWLITGLHLHQWLILASGQINSD